MFLAVSSDSYITVWNMKEGKLVKETENDLIEGISYKAKNIQKKSVLPTNVIAQLARKVLWH